MEPEEGPHPADGRSVGKRRWTSEFEDQTYGISQHVPSSDSHSLHIASTRDGTTRKRPKVAAEVYEREPHDQIRSDEPRGRATLGKLPPEILQHICTFLHPISLGRMICVNRHIRSLLDPAVPLPPSSSQIRYLKLRSQESVWATSRKRFLHGFPKPMHDMGELQMWRLIRRRACQFCGKLSRKREETASTSPWEAGPGPENVRTIWPFRIMSCGRCLGDRIVKETELLLSGSSVLRPGLPYAILTSLMHYIPSAILERTQLPPQLELTKYYFKPQIEELQAQLRSVQPLGASALEEWLKGLETDGRQANLDAARFDQWELHGGRGKLASIVADVMKDTGPSLQNNMGREGYDRTRFSPVQAWQLITPTESSTGRLASTSAPLGALSSEPMIPRIPGLQMAQVEVHPRSATSEKRASALGGQQSSNDPVDQIVPGQHRRQRVERSKQEVEHAKLARRKEIEMRCQEFQPPINPTTLPFMDAFKAAIQIPQALNDKAWEVLKPRLLAQRVDAERREQLHNATSGTLALANEERKRFEEEQRVAVRNETNMWQELKIPARDRIQRYAQEFIHQTWSDGGGVTKTTASKFAAEVLCHARQRFDEVIAQEDRMLALKGTAFPQDRESLSCRRLKLKDMKWLFEEAVRPHTRGFGRELFLCRVCDTNQKLFSFEAVVQHYAAKHTSELSHGSIIVYWDADWPVEPPFDPSPNIPWVFDGGHGLPQIDKRPQPRSQAGSSRQSGQAANESLQARADYVADSALEFWQRTDGIWDLSMPVRLFIIIQHISLQYLKRFRHELTLLDFMDLVSNRPELEFLRRLAGFRCKTCLDTLDTSPSRLDGPADQERSLPDLLRHFHRLHDSSTSREQVYPPPLPHRSHPDFPILDWKRDMIYLPSAATIKALPFSRGIDRDKLQIISDAFPEHFPQPMSGGSLSEPLSDYPQRMFPQASQFMAQQLHRAADPSPRIGGAGSYVARSEGSVGVLDQYDPHHPAPAIMHRQPHVPRSVRSSPPRRTTQYRTLPRYTTGYQVSEQDCHRETEAGDAWERSEREGPLSHDSVVYSHEGGSSRWSYREPLTEYSETTVGTLSEVRPESKATSRQSLSLVPDSDVRSRSGYVRTQPGSDGAHDLNPAADFLANFDPMANETFTSAGLAATGSLMRPIEVEVQRSRPGTVLSVQPPSHQRMTGFDVEHRSSPQGRYTHSLPLREGTQLPDTGHLRRHDNDLAVSDGFMADVPLRTAPDREYLEALPERLHREQHQSMPRHGEYGSIFHTIPARETRYHPGDTHNYGDRPYKYAENALEEHYSYRIPSERYVEIDPSREPRYIEHIQHPDDREEYLQVVPRGYRAVEDGHGLQQISEAHRYIRHDAQSIPAENYGARYQRLGEGGNRDVIYMPTNEARRHPSRRSRHDPSAEDIL
ncbi:hypothetical protein EDD37DRAFT_270593 [Exophiala viscosa]|uniref:F-box domain-containing protein n=1 Tax=Exophiala viscosa TaxID=2486360 RepID=A0AAN6E6T4_9EURO|nr:hypothetical protein EDD36DRAFT_414205 [Exophiala viscosa]KAI1627670.1 hypothetical protein EDD37DRAFT_270593 [Exophiala viscosa]